MATCTCTKKSELRAGGRESRCENKFEQDACHLPLMILRLRKDPQIVRTGKGTPPLSWWEPVLVANSGGKKHGGRTICPCESNLRGIPPFYSLD